MNRVILAGRLSRDIQMAESGKVAFGTIATEVGWDKEKKESRVEFVPFTAFGLSESLVGIMKKGQQVIVEGQVTHRSREKDGGTVYETSIVVQKWGIKLFFAPKEQASTKEESTYDPADF